MIFVGIFEHKKRSNHFHAVYTYPVNDTVHSRCRGLYCDSFFIILRVILFREMFFCIRSLAMLKDDVATPLSSISCRTTFVYVFY